MKGSIETLTAENFDEELASFEGLAVVKFWAPWCRTCKAIGPKYETVAFQHLEEVQANRVRFYQVNFKEHGALCLSQRVMGLPTIHFYMAGIGRVSRCVVDSRTVQKKITDELSRFLESGHLETLQQLASSSKRGGREAVVRYTDVMSVLSALAAGRAVPTAEEDKVGAARYKALASDDTYMRDLERLFRWLDQDDSGELDASEIQAAVSLLSARAGRQSEAEGAKDDGESTDGEASLAELSNLDGDELLSRAAAASEDADASSETAPSIDFAAFVRLMTSQAVAELSSAPGQERLQQAFASMDTDGNGEISMDEMLTAVSDVCMLLPNGASQAACGEPSRVMEAFDAFDTDASGAIDYEEFVAMVSGRGNVYEAETNEQLEEA